MQHLTLSSYQKVNGSFHRRLIYHAGIDCGFCVELNYMINAGIHHVGKNGLAASAGGETVDN